LIKAKQKAQAVHCMNNNKQLMLALLMYAGDHDDWLPANDNELLGAPVNASHQWVGGGDPVVDPTTWTNIEFLTNPKYAALAPYIGSQYRIYKCPADNKYPWTDPAGMQFPTVRSCAMNFTVGTEDGFNLPIDPTVIFQYDGKDKWLTYGRMSDMVNPGPANLFIFIDVDQYSNVSALFWMNMSVQPTSWGQRPSVRHNFAGTFAFADGHGEIHKWTDARTGTIVPVFNSLIGRLDSEYVAEQGNPDNADILWLQAHTTALRNPAE
jgi:prepilin-type processing-associated H-X9-DG protein